MAAGVKTVLASVLLSLEGEEQQCTDELHQKSVSGPESVCGCRDYSGEEAQCTICYKNEPLNCLNLVLRGNPRQ